jgi:hypothetical protein
MKTIARLTLASLLLTAASYAADLRMRPTTTEGADTLTAWIQLDSPEALTGLQFNLEYDAAALDVVVEPGPATRSTAKELKAYRLGMLMQRVTITGTDQRRLAAGIVAIVHVSRKKTAAPGAKSGGKYTVKLAQPGGADSNGGPVDVTASNALVSVP